MADPAGPKKLFAREATGFTRQLSALDSLGIALSSMGPLFAFNVIVFLPALYPEANLLATPLLGLIIMLPVAGVYILMSIAMPRAGGDYIWVSRVIHPSVGFVSNFALSLISLATIGIGTPTIVQRASAEMFYDFGKLYDNSNYLNIATSLQNANTIFLWSAVLIVVTGLIVIFSSRLSAAVLKYWTFAAIISARSSSPPSWWPGRAPSPPTSTGSPAPTTMRLSPRGSRPAPTRGSRPSSPGRPSTPQPPRARS